MRAGPCASHTGQIFASSDWNLALGTTRLTKSRAPQDPHAEGEYRKQQHRFIGEHPEFIELLKGRYDAYFHDFTNALDEAELHYADPHAKRDLRINTWGDLVAFNTWHASTVWNLPGKMAVYKVKKAEVAKIGKTIRCIGDLGCAASLQGFRLTGVLKEAMFNEKIHINGGDVVFCKEPSPEALIDAFTNLISPPGRFYFVFFSDDSCLAIRQADGTVLRYNMDISSCDASHTASLFRAFVAIHPHRLQADARKLVAQCEQAVSVTCASTIKGEKKKRVVLKPLEPRLYSGATITTAINNLACWYIILSISLSTINNSTDIIAAAARAGYVVTCEDCHDWHNLQFLKHSPVYDTEGKLRALLNLGVMLRFSGTSKGDFLGSKTESMRTRVNRQQAGLLRGAYPRAHFPLVDQLKRNCATQASAHDVKIDRMVDAMFAYKVAHSAQEEHYHIHSDEVYKRYNLTALETLQMDTEFASCGYGDFYASEATDKIYKTDYGIGAAFLDGPPVLWESAQAA